MSFGAGDSAWRHDTPGAYMLDVVRAAGSFGESFSKSFNQASGQKQDQKQFDAKLAENQRQFTAELIEKKRMFDIQNPDMTRSWNTSPITAKPQGWAEGMAFEDGGRPPIGETVLVGEKGPELFVADKPGTIVPNEQTPVPRLGVGWDGSSPKRWMDAPSVNWRATNALDVLGKITQAQSFEDLSTIQKQNPEAGMYPQVLKALQSKSIILQRSTSAELATRHAANAEVGAKQILQDAEMFNKRMATLQAQDPEAWTGIVQMEQFQHPTLGTLPSLAQKQVLGVAEKTIAMRKENERKIAELEAVERGDVQHTTITEKGVTKSFAPPKPAEDTTAEPLTKQLTDGTTLAWLPGSKGLHIIRADGEKQLVTPSQLFQIGKGLKESGDEDGTNFMNMAKSMIRTGGVVPQTTSAPTDQPAATTNAPSDPTQRKSGTTYQTPKGALKWTGTGWVQP